jgi:hypothetical protein
MDALQVIPFRVNISYFDECHIFYKIMKSRILQLEWIYLIVSKHSWFSKKRRFCVRLLSCGISNIKLNLYRGYIHSACKVNKMEQMYSGYTSIIWRIFYIWMLITTASVEVNSRNGAMITSQNRVLNWSCTVPQYRMKWNTWHWSIFSACVDKHLLLFLDITNLFFKYILRFIRQIWKKHILKIYLKINLGGFEY